MSDKTAKPCPFCGVVPHEELQSIDPRIPKSKDNQRWVVMPSCCNNTLSWYRLQDWNTRAGHGDELGRASCSSCGETTRAFYCCVCMGNSAQATADVERRKLDRIRGELEELISARDEAVGRPALSDSHAAYIRATEHYSEKLEAILATLPPTDSAEGEGE